MSWSIQLFLLKKKMHLVENLVECAQTDHLLFLVFSVCFWTRAFKKNMESMADCLFIIAWMTIIRVLMPTKKKSDWWHPEQSFSLAQQTGWIGANSESYIIWWLKQDPRMCISNPVLPLGQVEPLLRGNILWLFCNWLNMKYCI